MSYEKNIPKYYLLKFLVGLNFLEATFILFLLSNNLTFFQVLLTQSWFAIIITIFQIPVGAISDIWSRKKVLIAGFFLCFLATITYFFSSTFPMFLLAETFWGIGFTATFGTANAFTYESSRNTKKNNSRQVFSRGAFYLQLGGIAAPLLGSLFALKFGLRSGFLLNSVGWLILIPVFMFSKEPPKMALGKPKYREQISKSASYIKKNKLLLLLMISYVTIAIISWLSYGFYQPHLISNGVSLMTVGLVFSLSNLLAAFLCLKSHKIEEMFGMPFTVILTSFLPVLGLLILGLVANPIFMILGLLLVSVTSKFREPIFADYYNNLVKDDKRATIIAFSDFSYFIIYSILAPIMGYLADIRGTGIIFVALSFIGIGSIIFVGSSFRNGRHRDRV